MWNKCSWVLVCLFCEPTSHHPDGHFLKLDAIQYIYTKGRISEHCNQGCFFFFLVAHLPERGLLVLSITNFEKLNLKIHHIQSLWYFQTIGNFSYFCLFYLITSFLQMDWLTQLMENKNGFLEQLTLDQWSPCVVDYCCCCCCCCSQLVRPCEERKKRLVPNTLLPLVLELVTLVVVKTRVLSQTHSPDHKKRSRLVHCSLLTFLNWC